MLALALVLALVLALALALALVGLPLLRTPQAPALGAPPATLGPPPATLAARRRGCRRPRWCRAGTARRRSSARSATSCWRCRRRSTRVRSTSDEPGAPFMTSLHDTRFFDEHL